MIHTQLERDIKKGIITCLPNISTTAICRQAPARLQTNAIAQTFAASWKRLLGVLKYPTTERDQHVSIEVTRNKRI